MYLWGDTIKTAHTNPQRGFLRGLLVRKNMPGSIRVKKKKFTPKNIFFCICVEFLSHNIISLQLVKIEILDPSVGSFKTCYNCVLLYIQNSRKSTSNFEGSKFNYDI